jgi:SAM-dependent methyltransferase
VRDRLKKIAARLARPALEPIGGRVDRLERTVDRLASSLEVIAGSVLDREKHREELAYWRWLFKTPEGRASMGGIPPQDLFAQWQRDRLRELGKSLQLQRGGTAASNGQLDKALDDWCAQQSAVEIGAGPFPALAAAPRWRRAVAVDPLARSYGDEGLLPASADHIVYIEASGERIPLPGSFADLVIIENALDHVSDPAAVLAEIRRLLRDGGLLWLLVDLSNYSDHMHPHPFNEERLRGLLTSAGFEPVKDRVSDHKSHPKAYGEYRGLLRKVALNRISAAAPAGATQSLAAR